MVQTKFKLNSAVCYRSIVYGPVSLNFIENRKFSISIQMICFMPWWSSNFFIMQIVFPPAVGFVIFIVSKRLRIILLEFSFFLLMLCFWTRYI